jgi:hypothetical protein
MVQAVARHDVGPVGKERDAAEALGFALGEVAVLGFVEAGELGVFPGSMRTRVSSVKLSGRGPCRVRVSSPTV